VVRRQQEVEHPRRGLFRRTRPPHADDGLPLRQDFRLDEELLEGWMRGVGARRFEDRLAVAGDSQCPGGASALAISVREADATQLDVVLWRNGDVGPGLDIEFGAATVAGMTPQRDRPSRRERGFDKVFLQPGWLRCGRPRSATCSIPQVAELPQAIAGGILTPT